MVSNFRARMFMFAMRAKYAQMKSGFKKKLGLKIAHAKDEPITFRGTAGQ